MRTEKYPNPHKLGLVRLTGDNTGLFYTNERTETVFDVETGENIVEWVYDVYEVSDTRNPRKVKNDVIDSEHPFGDELKILRKTIRKILTEKKYNSEEYAEFRAYNEFAESI